LSLEPPDADHQSTKNPAASVVGSVPQASDRRQCSKLFERLCRRPAAERRSEMKTASSSSVERCRQASATLKWWSGGGSNSRPLHCERSALPAELPPQSSGV